LSHAIDDVLGSVGFTHADKQVTRLNEVSAKRLPYPYSIMKRVEGERGPS
jgi:hypothetical protein